MLNNDYALLLIRGERPVMDQKYNLMNHPNVKETEDGGAAPYDYAQAPLAHDDFPFDETRYEDYELLSGNDLTGESFDGRNADED